MATGGKQPAYALTTTDSTSLSILKIWMIVGVVFIHSVAGEVGFTDGNVTFEIPLWLDWIEYIIKNVISRCAVPAYFVMSSLLLYKKPFTWAGNLKKKVRTLVIPYVLMNAFWILFFFVAQQFDSIAVYFPRPESIVANWKWYQFLDAFVGFINKYPLLYPLWFMRDLMALNLLAPAIKAIIDKFPVLFGALLTLLLLFDVDTHIFCLPIGSLFYFAAGYYLVKYGFHFSSLTKINGGVIGGAYIGGIVADCLTRSRPYHTVFHTIAVILGILFFAKGATMIRNGRIQNLLLWLSKFSIAIYLFHEFGLTILTKLLARVLPNSAGFQMLQFFGNVFIIIACCILLGVLMQKYTPKIYALLTGNR